LLYSVLKIDMRIAVSRKTFSNTTNFIRRIQFVVFDGNTFISF